MLILIAANGPDKGRVFEFPEDDSRVLGRGSGPRCLLDNTASRMHAEVTCRDGQWFLNDLHSTNGTFLNGQKIASETLIKEGDHVQIGCTQLAASYAHNDATIAGNIALVQSRPEDVALDNNVNTPARSTTLARTPYPGLNPNVIQTAGGQPVWVQQAPQNASTPISRWLVVLTAAMILYFGIDVYYQHRLETNIRNQAQQPVSLKPELEQKITSFIDDYTVAQDQPAQVNKALLAQVQETAQHQKATQLELQENKKHLQELTAAIQKLPAINEQALIQKISSAIQSELEEKPEAPKEKDDTNQVLTDSLGAVQAQIQALLNEINSLKTQQFSAIVNTEQASTTPTGANSREPDHDDQTPTPHSGKLSNDNAALTQASETTGGVLISDPFVNAKKIVFVVDASGSLIDSMPRVADEVSRKVAQLDVNREFSVFFYQNDRVIEAPPSGLKPGSDPMKNGVSAWIKPSAGHIHPSGSSNPVDALQKAMSYQPDLIYIYSDTITGNRPGEISHLQLLQELDQLNKDRVTRISTVQFFYEDPQETLRTIAFEHGGAYLFIEEPKPVEMPSITDIHSDLLPEESPSERGNEQPEDLNATFNPER